MTNLASRMKKIQTLILDMDGVIYIGDSPIEGVKETIEKLRLQGKKLVFMTNNSAKTRLGYAKKLGDLGLKVNEDDIITSAYATATYLQKESSENGKVFVVGEEGLKSELEEAGFEILSKENAEDADFVVAGMDRNLTYDKIAAGLRALLAGAEFIASNPDPTYPTETGLSPGAGASIGALSGASGVEPALIVGKPSRYMIDIALKKTDSQPDQAAIIGDRLDLDIKTGKKVGLTTILVLTGVSSNNDVKKVEGTPNAPDFVLESIRELVED